MINCKCAKDDDDTLKYYLAITYFTVTYHLKTYKVVSNYLLGASVLDLVVPSDS